MKILLIGYGKMGRTLERLAIGRGHTITGTPDTYEALQQADVQADVAIEFTQPDAVVRNLNFCFEHQLPVVSGTTGWLDQREEVEKYCRQQGGGLFYASNFSLGVNLFFKLNEQLARLLGGQSAYSVKMKEIHHTQKLDAPSGTAITLAEGIVPHRPELTGWVGDGEEAGKIPITSVRENAVPGTHVVTYASDVDTIEIAHTAHSREGFALGAVCVAEWMAGKKGIYSMQDYLAEI